MASHLLRSLGRDTEGGLRGSRGRKKVPRLLTMRNHVGGLLVSSINDLKNATCSASMCDVADSLSSLVM